MSEFVLPGMVMTRRAEDGYVPRTMSILEIVLIFSNANYSQPNIKGIKNESKIDVYMLYLQCTLRHQLRSLIERTDLEEVAFHAIEIYLEPCSGVSVM